MNKREFVALLRKGLAGLPLSDIEERVIFYSEMIDDRMEEGVSEADAVTQVGDIDNIVAQIKSESAQAKPEKSAKPKKALGALEIVLIVLGAPVWLSLLIAAFAVVLSVYTTIWSVIISLWAVFGSLAACSIGGVLACVVFTVGGNGASGVAMLAAGVVCAGLSIFMFYGCKTATDGTLILTKKMAIWIKNCFRGKEVA